MQSRLPISGPSVLLPACALVAGFVPSTALAQANDDPPRVETTAPPPAEGDPRHPTTTADRVVIEAPYADSSDLAMTLARLPGVHTRRTSFGQTSFATIRGSTSRQVAVEWEGLRLNPPFGPGYDLAGTSLLGFDEVLVLRGPAAAYRPGALEGALEFRTRHLRTAGSRFVGSALFGSHDTRAASADVSVATDDVSNRLAIAARSSEGDFEFVDAQGERAERVNNDHERFSAFGSTELRAGRTTVRATALADGGERGTPGQSEFQQRFADARLSDGHATGIVRVERHGRTVQRRAIDTHAVAGVQLRSVDYHNPSPFLGGDPVEQSADASVIGSRAGLTRWSEGSVGRLELSARHETWEDSIVSAERVEGGAGASWEQRFAEDRLLLFGAARSELDDEGRFALIPTAGASWTADEWTVRANAGRTRRTPDLDELYLRTETVRGNRELEPERAWTGDAGVRWETERASAELIAFGRLVDSAILFLPVSATLVEARNIEGTWAAGVEAQGSLRAGIVAASATYTLTEARFVETNLPVPLQPTHAATARVGVHVLGERRPLEAWSGADVRDSVHLDSFGNQTARGYVFWDAGLTGRVNDVTLRMTVRNLLDDDGAVDALQQPLPGRTFWVALALATGSR